MAYRVCWNCFTKIWDQQESKIRGFYLWSMFPIVIFHFNRGIKFLFQLFWNFIIWISFSVLIYVFEVLSLGLCLGTIKFIIIIIICEVVCVACINGSLRNNIGVHLTTGWILWWIPIHELRHSGLHTFECLYPGLAGC